jgi:putative copper resistance protein D
VGFILYLSNASLGDPNFGPGFVQFISAVPLGQAWLATTIAAALVTVLAIAVRSHTGVALLTVAAVVALVPMALQGHAAESPGDHGNAIVAFGMHIVGAAVWLGGLAALVVLGRRMRGQALADLVSRYSTIALVCFLVVSVSGVLSAAIRLIEPGNLLTPYGVLVLVKTAALIAAGMLGALYRGVLIPRIASGPGRRPFFLVVAGELVILGVASGFAAGLAFSAPPDGTFRTPTTPAEILTGGTPLPAPMTLVSVATGWHFDVLWVLICAFLALLYVLGARRLRRRGDRWPVGRTISWLAGVAVLFWLTNGGLAVYQDVLFSAHMLVHMALTMLVPLLLVPAAPVTLALRAIRKRQDGTRGGREWLLLIVQSRVSHVLTNPIVAAVLFAGSLIVFYYSPLFRWAATDHIGHEWMTAHFLITGYLFVQSMLDADPIPFRLPYPLRLLVLLATMAFHAFFGLALLVSSGLLLADWYGAMGWGTSALDDQHAAGGIAWSVGEIPTAVLAIVVAISWSRSDERESRRSDRSEERSGDADLGAYNDMLARLQRERA